MLAAGYSKPRTFLEQVDPKLTALVLLADAMEAPRLSFLKSVILEMERAGQLPKEPRPRWLRPLKYARTLRAGRPRR